MCEVPGRLLVIVSAGQAQGGSIIGRPGTQRGKLTKVKERVWSANYLIENVPIARHHNTLTNIDADVAHAERLLTEALAKVPTRQEDRHGASDFERRVRDIRFELENLWTLRRQHVGQAATQGPFGFIRTEGTDFSSKPFARVPSRPGTSSL